MANCGTSMTITVSCIVALPTQEVLDIRLENADGERSSVCSVPDLPGTAIMVYSLAPGDSIYGVQACYRNGRVVGVTFSSAGGPLVCGNPQAPEAVCRSTSVTEPAPMSAMYGECGRWGLVEITRVCFNPFYINPVIPITGVRCFIWQPRLLRGIGSSATRWATATKQPGQAAAGCATRHAKQQTASTSCCHA
jgi:hypothetical protein